MSHIHVCLVSEQTIPNILGIYHYKPDKVVFCSTKKMEGQNKADAILGTLRLYGLDYSESSERVIVDQDCLEECELKFGEIAEKYNEDRVVVNLTGGTKIMVLGAYNAFNSLADGMIYTPIPKNEFITVFPREDNCRSPVPYNLKLSVDAYVTAYGVKVKNRKKIEQLKSTAQTNKDLCIWMAQNYKGIETLLSEFYTGLKDHRDDKNFRLKMDYMAKREEERILLKRLGMPEGKIEKTLSKYEIRFLTGDWLSDFCFNEVLDLDVDDCVTGIELTSPKGTDNEFDVMFTKDNALYIVECKSLRQKHDKDADILYKISALQHDFGLRVDGFLVSTARNIISDRGDIKEHIIRRSNQCKTKVIHPDELKNLKTFIKSKVYELS